MQANGPDWVMAAGVRSLVGARMFDIVKEDRRRATPAVLTNADILQKFFAAPRAASRSSPRAGGPIPHAKKC
jgi:hypothetical protein